METRRSGRLILASDNPYDRVFATACAETAGIGLARPSSLEEALTLTSHPETEALLYDGTSDKQLSLLATARIPGFRSDRVHLMIPPERLVQSGQELDCRRFGHLLLRRNADPAANGRTYGTVLRGVTRGEEVDLTAFLPLETPIRTLQLDRPLDKQDCLATASQELARHGIADRISALITGAWDELLINAFFDAPEENRRQNHESTENLALRPREAEGKPVQFQFGIGGPWVAVTVTDQYGSLSEGRVLHHLTHYYNGITDKAASKVRQSAGLGLGLALILRSGGSLSFLSVPGKRTSVTLVFRLNENLPAFKSQFQFASIQSISPEAARGPSAPPPRQGAMTESVEAPKTTASPPPGDFRKDRPIPRALM